MTRITSRSVSLLKSRKCQSCNYETRTFYCLVPFSWKESQCAQCFVDGLMADKKEVFG
jgi:hypothetical protein